MAQWENVYFAAMSPWVQFPVSSHAPDMAPVTLLWGTPQFLNKVCVIFSTQLCVCVWAAHQSCVSTVSLGSLIESWANTIGRESVSPEDVQQPITATTMMKRDIPPEEVEGNQNSLCFGGWDSLSLFHYMEGNMMVGIRGWLHQSCGGRA